MSNPYFQFKQFTVWHDRCAMKVGTDGVLLGAWCHVDGARKALDVGTGSGLIALMIAQRNPELQVLGIDIDVDSVIQAQENSLRSPFAQQLNIQLLNLKVLEVLHNYDLVVSNPPFYTEDTVSPQEERKCGKKCEESAL